MTIAVVFHVQLSSDIIGLITFNTNEDGEKPSSKCNDIAGVFHENHKNPGNYGVS
ncbi:hypothetical protein T4C_12351 [Trichinella pseudospiralis]|uniref:Uncharacterized protein n=1 Tax=Trichinella pseudospiralis TaxID=6337 RepID=A0A0V1GJ38_TRIPS|nr:hypothetical protein T4C_12351 [Trichinella pseudospiralis]